MKYFFVLMFSLSSVSLGNAESKLDHFEKTVSSDKDEKKNKKSRGGSLLLNLAEAILAPSGSESGVSQAVSISTRVVGDDVEESPGKDVRFSLDYGYQRVDDTIKAHNYGLTLGYKKFGLTHSTSNTFEKNPKDRMRFSNTAFLFALSTKKAFEWNFGLGMATLKGNDRHSSFSITNLARIDVLTTDNFGLGLKLDSVFYWLGGNSLNKNDLALKARFEFFSIEAGYQWHYARNTNFELNGPYIGMSFYH